MPTLYATTELVEHLATPADLHAQYKARRTSVGLVRSLLHKMTGFFSLKPQESRGSECPVQRAFEAPMDQFTREYPALAPYALAMV